MVCPNCSCLATVISSDKLLCAACGTQITVDYKEALHPVTFIESEEGRMRVGSRVHESLAELSNKISIVEAKLDELLIILRERDGNK